MNKYQISSIDEDIEIVAAKMLITNSGVAMFKNFAGETFAAYNSWDKVILLEENIQEPDEDDVLAALDGGIKTAGLED